ncbi:MAG: hypothetical protein Q8T04_20465 [Bacteroidota bacterium]|nr:hypothetical protein [Bacteroidota bacterium]
MTTIETIDRQRYEQIQSINMRFLYTTPCAIIASATLINPPMLAPFT